MSTMMDHTTAAAVATPAHAARYPVTALIIPGKIWAASAAHCIETAFTFLCSNTPVDCTFKKRDGILLCRTKKL
jgi:hypothetical protein